MTKAIKEGIEGAYLTWNKDRLQLLTGPDEIEAKKQAKIREQGRQRQMKFQRKKKFPLKEAPRQANPNSKLKNDKYKPHAVFAAFYQQARKDGSCREKVCRQFIRHVGQVDTRDFISLPKAEEHLEENEEVYFPIHHVSALEHNVEIYPAIGKKSVVWFRITHENVHLVQGCKKNDIIGILFGDKTQNAEFFSDWAFTAIDGTTIDPHGFHGMRVHLIPDAAVAGVDANVELLSNGNLVALRDIAPHESVFLSYKLHGTARDSRTCNRRGGDDVLPTNKTGREHLTVAQAKAYKSVQAPSSSASRKEKRAFQKKVSCQERQLRGVLQRAKIRRRLDHLDRSVEKTSSLMKPVADKMERIYKTFKTPGVVEAKVNKVLSDSLVTDVRFRYVLAEDKLSWGPTVNSFFAVKTEDVLEVCAVVLLRTENNEYEWFKIADSQIEGAGRGLHLLRNIRGDGGFVNGQISSTKPADNEYTLHDGHERFITASTDWAMEQGFGGHYANDAKWNDSDSGFDNNSEFLACGKILIIGTYGDEVLIDYNKGNKTKNNNEDEEIGDGIDLPQPKRRKRGRSSTSRTTKRQGR